MTTVVRSADEQILSEHVMVDPCVKCGRATSPTVVARSWVIGITTMQYS